MWGLLFEPITPISQNYITPGDVDQVMVALAEGVLSNPLVKIGTATPARDWNGDTLSTTRLKLVVDQKKRMLKAFQAPHPQSDEALQTGIYPYSFNVSMVKYPVASMIFVIREAI